MQDDSVRFTSQPAGLRFDRDIYDWVEADGSVASGERVVAREVSVELAQNIAHNLGLDLEGSKPCQEVGEIHTS